MGTRHLIAVYLDGQPRIAQYGQWDGYPSGNGKVVLDFARANLDTEEGRDQFKSQLRDKVKFGDDAYFQTIGHEVPPELSRDTSAEILTMVRDHEGPDPLMLANQLDFAASSLYCEWAYVIDLDHDTLEVYKGFNKGQACGRFSKMEGAFGYQPVTRVAVFDLNGLPEDNEFIRAADPRDAEDED